jgi:hypothetical protein
MVTIWKRSNSNGKEHAFPEMKTATNMNNELKKRLVRSSEESLYQQLIYGQKILHMKKILKCGFGDGC